MFVEKNRQDTLSSVGKLPANLLAVYARLKNVDKSQYESCKSLPKHRPEQYGSRVKRLLFSVVVQVLVGVFATLPALADKPDAELPGVSVDASNKRNLYQFDTGLRLGDASLFRPWWNALQRNTLQRVEFDRCIANVNSCPRQLRSLRHLVVSGRALSTEDQLQLVNRFLNRRDYDEDRRLNNPETPVPDVRSHWSTLYEFLDRGGDCEDYAAAKYFLLRMLGIDPQQMRVVVAWERKLRGFHAVLAYRWPDGAVWLLESDNVIKKRSHFGYRYVYALNERGVWDYRTEVP